MNAFRKFILGSLAGMFLAGIAGCTAVGAGVGAVTGASVSNGNPAATVGGAVAGGVIGHELGK